VSAVELGDVLGGRVVVSVTREPYGYQLVTVRCENGHEAKSQPHYFRKGPHCKRCPRGGITNHPLYKTWRGIIERCTNTNNPSWDHYGGRGITVCKRWCESFETFVSDVGERPPKHEIDRIDNDGNYEPSNVRWATRREQTRNTRRSKFIEYKGERRTVSEWAQLMGLGQEVLNGRLRSGWDVVRALETPVVPGGSQWRSSLTECKRGHPFSEENTRIDKKGSRVCRVCMRERYR